MILVGCDLHSRTQQVAVLDTRTGELVEQELAHEGDAVERFYRALPPPVTIGIETTRYTQWFHALMHQLGHTPWSCARRRPIGAMPDTNSRVEKVPPASQRDAAPVPRRPGETQRGEREPAAQGECEPHT